MSNTSSTLAWFATAVPEPHPHNQVVQIGCHLEEVTEMLDAMHLQTEHGHTLLRTANDSLKDLANFLKRNAASETLTVTRLDLLDSLADQLVTAIGTAYMLDMDIEAAHAEVNRSNFSKFEDGKPVFNTQGKITKGKEYSPPALEQFI